MAKQNPSVRALVEQALSVLPQELGCDSCAEYLAAYADYRLGGKMPPDSLKGVVSTWIAAMHVWRSSNYCWMAFRRQMTA